jgi:hypothetical protein
MEIPDDVFVFQMTDEGTTCDFCGVEDAEDAPGKDYLCEPFATGSGLVLSGEWWACSECSTMIDANRWESLAQRAAQFINPTFRVQYLAQMRSIHQEFAKHRRPIQ